MADHNIDILLRARDQASKSIRGVNKELSKTGRIGATASRGLRIAGVGLAAGATVIAGGIAVAVKSGLEDLATLESAVSSVDGAIKQVGLTGQVTGQQIAGWANDIERDIGAAFDDKDITAATSTLIRFGHVTEANIRPAMQVMTDLAVKTGSVESASTLLAKALADPTKAAGKLARAGVILTKQEQKQIAALVKSGKVGSAQALILDRIAQSTKGAALASQGPYARSIAVLADVSEDARKALAIGFLPVLEKLSGKLSKALADPAVVKNIENFGRGMAGALDDLIDFGEKVPWGAIGSGVKTAAEWTGKLFDAFKSIPPEAQATIIALAGLNKLSGGAVSGIVGELGKGLIKGVLGMTAGVVNINAGVVNGPGGGVPGGGVKIPPAAGVVTPAIGAAMALDLEKFHSKVVPMLAAMEAERKAHRALAGALTGHGGPGRGNVPTPGLTGHGGPGRGGPADVSQKITDLQHGAVSAIDGSKKATVDAQGKAGRDVGSKVTLGTMGTTGAVRMGAAGTMNTVNSGTSRIVGAIASNRPVVTTNVKVFVTPAGVTSSTSVAERYGSSTGSSGSGKNASNDDRHN